jgi:hypothetical protein
MDRIEHLTQVMALCHGKDAEAVARKRVARCRRRSEPEWSLIWQEVANRLSESATDGAIADRFVVRTADAVGIQLELDATDHDPAA